MSRDRKLQAEIGRTMKKIDEGIEIFDALYDKVYSADTQSQKLKHEGELKKEIKKLQRLRDSIKQWAANSDIKDKSSLNKYRKLIEAKMEAFKICEKETKTKAYSKEGLAKAAELSPEEKILKKCVKWVQESLDNLNQQIEECEADLETAASASSNARKKRGKKKSSALSEEEEELTETLENHRFHVSKLEKVIRLLENGSLDPDEVNAIKDSVDYYVQENQDDDFMNDDEIYEELDLESKLKAISAKNITKSSSSSSSSDSSSSSPTKKSAKKVVAIQALKIGRGVSKKTAKDNLAKIKAEEEKKVIAAQQAKKLEAEKQAKAKLLLQQQQQQLQLQKQAAAAAAQQKAAQLASSQKQQAAAQAARQKTAQRGNLMNNNIVGGNNSRHNMQQQQHNMQQQQQQHNMQQQQHNMQQQQHNMQQQQQQPHQQQPHQQQHHQQHQQLRHQQNAQRQQPQSRGGAYDVIGSGSNNTNHGDSKTNAAQQRQAIHQAANQGLNHQHLDKSTSIVPHAMTHHLLDAALFKLPMPSDSIRMGNLRHQARNPFNTPSIFPSEPSAVIHRPDLYDKLDVDTLFFIFYFQQGSYQQYLAAAQLKKQSWRYHKKYKTWFQRHEEPTETTDEYERGTYVYFDFESGWCQRIKAEFTFEYDFLEDDLKAIASSAAAPPAANGAPVAVSGGGANSSLTTA